MAVRLQIPTAAAFEPLLHPARYKGAWGGRGSGKSHFFGGLAVEDALRYPSEHGEGLRMVCIREVQKTLNQSAKKLIENKLQQFGLGEVQGFKVFRDVIETPKDGLIIFQGMQDHTADSVKSLEGFHRAWVEEAQSLSNRSMTLLRPTIRAEDSELWFGWNPDRATAAVDMLLRGDKLPTGATVVRANWSDNPWFPKTLEQERLDCLDSTPEKYGHIWDGEYATVLDGAYYAKCLTEAQLQGRIGFVASEPLNQIYAVWDIGGTSGKSDATAFWIVQFIGAEVRLLNYYEAVGQPFSEHVYWLQKNGYGNAICVLPHDGVKHDTVHKTTPKGYLQEAGFRVEIVGNQGKGAALQRIDAARLMFGSCRFDEVNTEAGRNSLGWYHEKKDEVRGIGLGPNHDFSSHCADAFGTIAVFKATIDGRSKYGKGRGRSREMSGIA
jgi:phage terminase large subunit